MKKLIILWCIVWAPVLLSSNQYSTEFRLGYFYPGSETMRNIYRDGGIDYELEQTYCFNNCWSAWANVNYFDRKGHSLGGHNNTFIRLLPISVGIKHSFNLFNHCNCYLGLGGSYTFLKIHDHSSYVKQHTSKEAFGVVGKAGFLYFLTDCVFLDCYADYYYTQISGAHHHRKVYSRAQDIGGLRAGLGIGIIK